MPDNDPLCIYSIENVLIQIKSAPGILGFFELRFYSDGKRPSKSVTDKVDSFYFYPSGGTIRDKNMNIIFYEPKLDKYHPTNRLNSLSD
jgi:hypothetical protein